MNDSENPNDEEQYHLKLSADDVAPRVLLPGDPDRVDTISHQWDATETASLALHLEENTWRLRVRMNPTTHIRSTVDGTPQMLNANRHESQDSTQEEF